MAAMNKLEKKIETIALSLAKVIERVDRLEKKLSFLDDLHEEQATITPEWKKPDLRATPQELVDSMLEPYRKREVEDGS